MNEQEATIKLINMLTEVIKNYRELTIENVGIMIELHRISTDTTLRQLLIEAIRENNEFLSNSQMMMEIFLNEVNKKGVH